MTGRSSVARGHQPGGAAHGTRLRTVRADGTPIYRYEPRSGMPPVSLIRFDPAIDQTELPADHRHAHDFLVLVYVEHGDVPVRIGGVDELMPAGAAYPISPGQVLGVGSVTALEQCRAWCVFFMPEAVLGGSNSASPLRWADHPLLSLFTPGGPGSLRRLTVPPAERRRWSEQFAALGEELAAPERVGAAQAATALLSQLLVNAARLARSTGSPPSPDPLVVRAFEIIEDHFPEPISTRDVAHELGYTTGHLTTLIRERTGRTVLDWISERRLVEARRMLAETDLALRTIAVSTGHRDGEYLSRRFRARYGMPPLRWRALSRATT